MKKREEDIQPQMKKAQISPSFPLESQASPMFFKLFKLQNVPQRCPNSCFSGLLSKCPTFPFYMLKNRSKRAAASCARQSLASWRATGEIPETTCRWLASWLCGSPAARQLARHWRAASLRLKIGFSLLLFPLLLQHLGFIELLTPVHLFLHKLERGLKSFYFSNIQALNSKFHTNE